MFILVGQMKKPSTMSSEEYRTWWRQEHVPQVLRIPGIQHYTVVPVDSVYDSKDNGLSDGAPMDGIAILHFESREAMLEVLSSPQGEEDRDHLHEAGLESLVVVGEGETLVNHLPKITAEESLVGGNA